MSRVVVWFSCGAASACAAKLAVEKYGPETHVVYCDTLAYEHPDNRRFLSDVEKWIGKTIEIVGSKKYKDIYDVFERTRYLVGVAGARCTTELKKNVRMDYQLPDDTHVFGLTVGEEGRIASFESRNPIELDWILIDAGFTKSHCLGMVKDAGIELPMMYRLGYKNNDCIGCVKGGAGYWNKIRVDFPEAFDRMAKMERKLDAAINKRYKDGKRVRIFLDELPPDMGLNDFEPDIECGVLCVMPLDSGKGGGVGG